MKKCVKCKKLKHWTEFNECAWTPDNLNIVCKPCEVLAENLDPNQITRKLAQLNERQFLEYEEQLLKQEKDAESSGIMNLHHITKLCGHCEENVPISQFSRDSKSKDGLQAYCKKCHTEINRLWREENLDWARTRDHVNYMGRTIRKPTRTIWYDTNNANKKVFI